MIIEATVSGEVIIKEAYVGPIFRTREGHGYGICMRDGTIEIIVVGDAPLPRVFKNGDQVLGLSRED